MKIKEYTEAEQAALLEICNDRFIDRGTHLEIRHRYNPMVQVGDRAGWTHRTGYRYVGINLTTHSEHRLAWLMRTGAFPEGEIDHIDGNRLNQSPDNLRVVTHQENHRNKKRRCDNTSGMMGVHGDKRRGKWHARIKLDGKRIHLGYFDDFFEAACARKSAEKRYGFHRNHGREA
jgi:hypothetical protein